MLCLAPGQAEQQAKRGLGAAPPTPLRSPGPSAVTWLPAFPLDAPSQRRGLDSSLPPLLLAAEAPLPASLHLRGGGNLNSRALEALGAGTGNCFWSWWVVVGCCSSLHSWESLQRVSVSWGFATPSPLIRVQGPAHCGTTSAPSQGGLA